MNAHGILSLWADDVLVLALDVSKDISKDYSEWRAVQVDAFSAGPWMAQIAELHEHLAALRRGRLAKSQLDYVGGKAGRIELDD